MADPLRIAVLVSGQGTLLEAIARASEAGSIPARIVGVLSDRPNVPALERARDHGLPSAVLSVRERGPAEWTVRATDWLVGQGAGLLLLAGFRSILPSEFVARWRGRVVNVHPSLLPAFGGRGMYGEHVHRAVLDAGVPETGATLHLVTDEVDLGRPLLQERLPVLRGDTPTSLRERLRPVEIRLLEEAIRRFADGRWKLPLDAATA